eukprot:936741-Rhodomonas_salina.3
MTVRAPLQVTSDFAPLSGRPFDEASFVTQANDSDELENEIWRGSANSSRFSSSPAKYRALPAMISMSPATLYEGGAGYGFVGHRGSEGDEEEGEAGEGDGEGTRSRGSSDETDGEGVPDDVYTPRGEKIVQRGKDYPDFLPSEAAGAAETGWGKAGGGGRGKRGNRERGERVEGGGEEGGAREARDDARAGQLSRTVRSPRLLLPSCSAMSGPELDADACWCGQVPSNMRESLRSLGIIHAAEPPEPTLDPISDEQAEEEASARRAKRGADAEHAASGEGAGGYSGSAENPAGGLSVCCGRDLLAAVAVLVTDL